MRLLNRRDAADLFAVQEEACVRIAGLPPILWNFQLAHGARCRRVVPCASRCWSLIPAHWRDALFVTAHYLASGSRSFVSVDGRLVSARSSPLGRVADARHINGRVDGRAAITACKETTPAASILCVATSYVPS